MNYIEYIAEMTVHLSNNILIEYHKTEITTIQIQKENSTSLNVRFNFIDARLTEEEAKEITEKKAEDLINLISYKFNTSYNGIHLSSFCKNGERIHFGRASFVSYGTMQIIGDNTLQIGANFKDNELLKELRSNPYHVMLREILTVNHTMTKFLLLYSLLYLLQGDSQNQVEIFVKENEKEVIMLKRVRSNGTFETKTIYTTLRNRVGHINKHEDINNLSKDMSKFLDGLLRLVKIAIEETHTKNIV